MARPRGSPSRLPPVLVLALGAVAISFSPVFVKLLGEGLIGPTAIGFWRTAIGAVVLFALLAGGRRAPRLARGAFAWSVFAGVAFCFDLWFWHRSILYAGSGMSTVLGNTQVFFTAFLSALLFGERLSVRFFLAAAGALAGVALLAGVWSESVVFTPLYLRGVIYGVLTGLAYAHYIVGIKRAGTDPSRPDLRATMAWTSLVAAVCLGAIAAVEDHPFWPPDARAVLLVTALGTVVQVGGWLAIVTSLTRIATARAALVLLLQPTLALAWGWWLFGEALAPLQFLGAALTLGAIYLGSVREVVAPDPRAGP